MAILISCIHCREDFVTSAGSGKCCCGNCDGTSAARAAEASRWAALPLEQKIEELRRRLDDVEQRAAWDGRIG